MNFWEKLKQVLVGASGNLVGGLKLAAGFIGARILAALGLAYVTYQAVLPDVKAFLNGYLNQLPTVVRELAGALGVDVFMILILSAYVAKIGTRAFLAGVNQIQNKIDQAGG